MKIPIPKKESLQPNTLKKVEVQGLKGANTIVFSLTPNKEEALSSVSLEIEDSLVAQAERVQFKYIHDGFISTALWYPEKPTDQGAKIKLAIPSKLRQNSERIAVAKMELKGDNYFEEFEIPKEKIISSGYFEIPLTSYHKAKEISCNAMLINGNRDNVMYAPNKGQAVYRSKLQQAALECMRTNLASPYTDDDSGRSLCLSKLNDLLSETEEASPFLSGDKNLIYYTVYFDSGYVELFDLSVTTILKYSDLNFDVLVITDEATKKLIENTEAAARINLKYFITKTPGDGVEASKQKVGIYRYPEINDYNKILFLDCDIIATKDINPIFDVNLRDNILYSAKSHNLNQSHFRTVHHGFTSLPASFVDEMRAVSQVPFNAGQFMFVNSERMQKHLANTQWFMDNWPSEYFFEQCFMCYYFCNAYMADTAELTNFFGFNTVTDNNLSDTSAEDKVFVHFIAPPLKADHKLKFIQIYMKLREERSYE